MAHKVMTRAEINAELQNFGGFEAIEQILGVVGMMFPGGVPGGGIQKILGVAQTALNGSEPLHFAFRKGDEGEVHSLTVV